MCLNCRPIFHIALYHPTLSVPLQIIHLYGGRSLLWRVAAPAAPICSCVLCNALSHLWPAWRLAAACNPCPQPQEQTWKYSTPRRSCSSLCRDIDCYRTITASNIIGLMIFGAFLKTQLVGVGECMGILLFAERKRFLRSVILL